MSKTRATGYRPLGRALHASLARPYRAQRTPTISPSTTIDLRSLAPQMRDQGSAGSCTAFAGRGACLGLIEAARRDGLWRGPVDDLSTAAIYTEELVRRGELAHGEGASLVDLVAVLERGLPLERLWPYDLARLRQRAPDDVWSGRRLVNATPLRHDLDEIRAALADGCPIVAGIPCYRGSHGILSDEAAAFGEVWMPSVADTLDGWHAVSVWGHVPNGDDGGWCWAQNSWAGFAEQSNGMFRVPARYLVTLADEIVAFGAVR